MAHCYAGKMDVVSGCSVRKLVSHNRFRLLLLVATMFLLWYQTAMNFGEATFRDKSTVFGFNKSQNGTENMNVKPAIRTPRYKSNVAIRSQSRFQPVHEYSHSANAPFLLLYSAWYDARIADEVRIIAVSRVTALPAASDLLCLYVRNVSSDGKDSDLPADFSYHAAVEKPVKKLWNIHSNHVGSVMLTCEPVDSINGADWWVSVVPTSEKEKPRNVLPVRKISIPNDRQTFAVCVQPLHGNFSNYHQLIEMIELNRLLGAEYFYFYNHSITAAVSRVLQHYMQHTDYVQVLPWNFDAQALGVKVAGQMAALADCQRRVMQRFDYLVHTDIDEFIIIRTQKTWLDFFKSTTPRLPPASQFVFANVYFSGPTYASELTKDAESRSFKLLSLQWNIRYLHALPLYTRSKAIARSECIGDHYIHFVGNFLDTADCRNLTSIDVSPDLGILHHYRYTTVELPSNKQLIQDDYVKNLFQSDLLEAVGRVHLKLK